MNKIILIPKLLIVIGILMIILGLLNITICVFDTKYQYIEDNYYAKCINNYSNNKAMVAIVGLFIIMDGIASFIIFKYIRTDESNCIALLPIYLILFVVICLGYTPLEYCVGILDYICDLFTLPFIFYLVLVFYRQFYFYINSKINEDYEVINSVENINDGDNNNRSIMLRYV